MHVNSSRYFIMYIDHMSGTQLSVVGRHVHIHIPLMYRTAQIAATSKEQTCMHSFARYCEVTRQVMSQNERKNLILHSFMKYGTAACAVDMLSIEGMSQHAGKSSPLQTTKYQRGKD